MCIIITNLILINYIKKYIEYISLYRDFSNINFQLTEKMRLASYFYNIGNLDSGDKKISEYDNLRNENINLAQYIPEIKEEINELCKLTFTEDELNYLRSLPFIKDSFIDKIRGFKLNKNNVFIV